MNLLDLRRISVKQRVRVRFRLTNGLECLVDERGTAQVPDLRAAADFSLTEEFEKAAEFTVEPAAMPGSRKQRPERRRVSRAELESMAGTAPAAHEDHDE